MRAAPLLLALIGLLTGCGGVAKLPFDAGVGPDPQLPAPHPELIPTVKVAKAVGWTADARPVAAPGLVVTRFAAGLDHPRWLHVLPNGDVLVAETNAPPRPKGLPIDVLTGFLDEAEQAQGRPVGVAIDATGALLVADDVGNIVWRVSAK